MLFEIDAVVGGTITFDQRELGRLLGNEQHPRVGGRWARDGRPVGNKQQVNRGFDNRADGRVWIKRAVAESARC